MNFFYLKYFLVISFFLLPLFSLRQNISINTTGVTNTSLSMLEILQICTTADSKGLFISHSGAVTTGSAIGYGIRTEMTGASTTNIAGYFSATNGVTNNYALIVPSGGGISGIGTSAPTANYLLTINTGATIQNGIDMTLSGGSGRGINISSASVNYDGILVSNSTASVASSVYNIGAVLSSTNIVSGYAAYRTGSGLSYGLYGINGTTATYATNANTWAAFLRGRTVISSESSPTSPLGTDLEVRNTTTGAAAPATISLRQTNQLGTTNNILSNFNFGDNYQTGPQAQIQVIRGVAGAAGDLPTDMLFYTTPDASTSLTERMRIINSGQVGINMYPSMMLDVASASTTASDALIRGASTPILPLVDLS